ncbi:hypothetical protein BH23ACT2_BH23ACT2_17100 [soil metagenome]
MTVFAYVLVPILVVAIAATLAWARNRQPTSLESGVDSFRREMDALSPDATPVHHRRTDPRTSSVPGPPRRPPSPDRSS